jgi:hypothetical protein
MESLFHESAITFHSKVTLSWTILSLVHSPKALYNKNKKRKTNNKIQGEQSMTQPNEHSANYENITTKYDEYISWILGNVTR